MKVLVFDLLACGANLDHLKGGGPELPCRWRSGNFPGCDTANVAVPERISRPLGSSLRERRAVEGPRVRILLPPAESQRTFGSSQDDGCFDGKEIMRSSNRRAGAAGGRQGQPRLSRRPANPACRA